MKRSQLIFLVVVVLMGLYLWSSYNSLVKKDELVTVKWNEVENAYQRRLELIPNLVNVVKGVSDYEKDVLTGLSEARSKASGITVNLNTGEGTQNYIDVQNNLASATNTLILTMERYPDIQGTKSYKDLMTQLEGTERRIKVARKDYNEAIQTYNQYVRQFPSSLSAKIFGFDKKQGFASDEGAEQGVDINF